MTGMRLIGALVAALAVALTPAASAQPGRVEVLAGYGGINKDRSTLRPTYHVNVRHRLVNTESVPLPAPLSVFLGSIPPLTISADGFFQYGDGGRARDACADPLFSYCTREAAPYWLLGAGLVSRRDVTSDERPVRLYFLPVTAALYLRGFDARRPPADDPVGEPEGEVLAGIGLGNGFGLRARIGEVAVVLELRTILVFDAEGFEGGGLPVSIGVAF